MIPNDPCRRRLERFDATLGAYLGELPTLGLGTLGRLVGEVKGHVGAVTESADPSWEDELRAAWAELEYVYALCLDGNRRAPAESEVRAIEEALVRLRALIADPAACGTDPSALVETTQAVPA